MKQGDKHLKLDGNRIIFFFKREDVAVFNIKSVESPGIYACLNETGTNIMPVINDMQNTGKDGMLLTLTFPQICRLEAGFHTVKREECSYLKIPVQVNNIEAEEPFEIFFQFLLINKEEPFFMVPGVLYGTNNEGISSGIQPRLAYRRPDAVLPESSSWHFRADRSPLPFVSAVYNEKIFCAGIEESYGHEDGKQGYNSLGIWTDKKGDRLSVALGSLDWPARLLGFSYSKGGQAEGICGRHGSLTSNLYIYWGGAGDRFAYEEFSRQLYYELHQPPRIVTGYKKALAQMTKAAVEDGYNQKSGFFYMLLSDDRTNENIHTAWAGILQIAQPLLEAGLILGDSEAVRLSHKMIDRVANEAYNVNSSLFYDTYYCKESKWGKNSWLEEVDHCAYINGQACYFLLRAFLLESKRGRIHQDWLECVNPVLRHAVETRREDGKFGIYFSFDGGRVTDYNGFAGCWFIAPLVMLYSIDRSHNWAMKASVKAVNAYYRDLQTMELLGAPLDIYKAPDEEGILGFIKAVVELHRITGEGYYLEYLRHALHYAFTWKFAYNTRHTAGCVNWSSCGGDITSTHNIHIHPMGNLIAEDIRYYYRHVKDRYFLDRLIDTILWGLQAYNHYEGEYGFGKTGWVSEQFYHTYVDYYGKEPDGGVWQAFLPWCVGSLLSSLTGEIPDDFLESLT